jgi:hypothetical protein
MAQGNYDHPSYLTRQMEVLGKTTAGASGTSLPFSFPVDIRARQLSVVVATAGTTAGAKVNLISLNGTTTTTVGSVATSTSTANTVLTSTDMNTIVTAGSLMYLTNGTDATSVAYASLHFHVDPSGTWVGP